MLTCRRTGKRTGEQGVSAVEFGLVLPIFLILLLGIIDYGFLYFVHLAMTNAAREGVRVGATQCNASTAAQTTTNNYLSGVGLSASVPLPADPRTTTNNTLQVSVTLNPFVPLIGFVPLPGTLQASASMRWEFADAQDLCGP